MTKDPKVLGISRVDHEEGSVRRWDEESGEFVDMDPREAEQAKQALLDALKSGRIEFAPGIREEMEKEGITLDVLTSGLLGEKGKN